MAAFSLPQVEVVVVVRELENGDCVVFPAAEPRLVSYGAESSCLEEQRLFLAEHLKEVPATELERYRLASELRLEEVEVTIPREDLPKRLRRLPPMRVPCLLVPAGRAAWVVALPLRHTFFVDDADDWRSAAADEIVHIAAARESTPFEYLELLPAQRHRLERIHVRIDDDADGETGTALSRHKAQLKKLLEEAALALLAEVGDKPGRAPKRLVGRAEPLRALTALLESSERLSVAVVGREQVGKSALILKALAGRDRVFVTSGARLIAGQSCFGQWQERLQEVMEAAETVDAVLYFDNLADLFSARGDREDFAGILRPFLERRRVRLVGEILPDAWEEASLRFVGFTSQLHPVRLEPLDEKATVRVLQDRRAGRSEGPRLEAGALAPLVDLAKRYFPYRAFPGEGVRLYDEVLARHAEALDAEGKPPVLTVADVFDAVSAETGIPSFLLRDDRALKLEEVRRAFERRVVGQRHAVLRVAETLCTVKASLQPTGRPLAVFLFVGPTGVGKTEVARTLASFLFGAEERMVRFDMSEYADPWAAERLIRGTDREEGLLTRRIRQQPFSVLLLDEIEKASPAVFDLLLQVMGEARLSDARGKTTYFHNTLLIMTSNLGAATRRERPGFADGAAPASSERYYQERVEEHFRPELVNRLDRVVAFEPLSAEEIRKIADLAVRRLGDRHGLAERGVRLDVEDGVLEDLARGAYDPAYGARQLYRHLEEHLAAPVAALLASRGAKAFGGTVEVRRGEEGPRLDLRAGVRRGKQRVSTKGLDKLAGLRREIARRLQGDSLRELRERIETLTVQLAHAGATPRAPNKATGPLLQDHHRLTDAWERLEVVRREVEDTEEMALLALFEAEDVDPFLAQVQDMARRWRSVLPYGLLALERPRPGVTLHLNEWNRCPTIDLWLKGLLQDAERRGWSVSGHVRDPDGKTWGPCSPASTLAAAAAPGDREHRRFLVHVSGPWAWAFVACEAGFHRYLNVEDSHDDVGFLEIHRLAWRTHLTKEEMVLATRLLTRSDTSDRLMRREAVRVYDFKTGELTVTGGATLRMEWQDYWPRFEEVAAEHLLVYERDGDRDRDTELLSVHFKG